MLIYCEILHIQKESIVLEEMLIPFDKHFDCKSPESEFCAKSPHFMPTFYKICIFRMFRYLHSKCQSRILILRAPRKGQENISFCVRHWEVELLMLCRDSSVLFTLDLTCQGPLCPCFGAVLLHTSQIVAATQKYLYTGNSRLSYSYVKSLRQVKWHALL